MFRLSSSVHRTNSTTKLNKILKQHKDDIKPNNIEKKRTAASIHVLQENHKFNYDSAEIIAKEENFKKRLTLEAIEINVNKNSTNLRSDIESLNPNYTTLLKYIPENKIN